MIANKSFNGLVPEWRWRENNDERTFECRIGYQIVHVAIKRLPDYIMKIKSNWDFMTQDGKLYCRLFDYYREADEILLTMILVLLEREHEELRLDNDCVAALRSLLLKDPALASSERNCRLECVGDGNFICRSQ